MAPKEKAKPLTATERQRRRREKLKKEGKYEEHKAKHISTMKRYRKRQADMFNSLTREEQAKIVQERREKDRLRKQKSRSKAAETATPVRFVTSSTSSPRPYSRKSSLTRESTLPRKDCHQVQEREGQ